jgi:hypothetical protein
MFKLFWMTNGRTEQASYNFVSIFSLLWLSICIVHLTIRLVPAFPQRRPRSIPGVVTWDLWWTKRHWGRFSPSTSVSPANRSTDCFTLIIIHHQGQVQRAKWWPTHQVDSVSPHQTKLKTNTHETWGHAVAKRLRHYATNRKVGRSIPDEVIFKFT